MSSGMKKESRFLRVPVEPRRIVDDVLERMNHVWPFEQQHFEAR
jgi:hypothetical protein